VPANQVDAQRRALLLRAALASMLLACGKPEPAPITQLLVHVDGDEAVRRELKWLRIQLYAVGSSDERNPLRTHDFALTQADPRSGEQRLPLSFGLVPGKHDRVEIVVRGYATEPTDDPAERARIERKVVATFRPATAGWVDTYLDGRCMDLRAPCVGLDRSCAVSASTATNGTGLCEALQEVIVTTKEPQGPPALAPGDADSGGCANARLCTSSDYPCVDSQTIGYECQGQFAEWPLPSRLADAIHPASYTTSDDANTVVDNVTGLVWQRMLPAMYEGCSGATEGAGSACTWEEAKAYCAALADGDFRLPTKIELETLVDSSRFIPAWPKEFPPDIAAKNMSYWTASAVVNDDLPENAWYVEFIDGSSSFDRTAAVFRVRCVRSVTTRPGTPADRYDYDEIDDVVSDLRTGLIWDRQEGPAVDRQQDAAAYCTQRGENRRLPTAIELLSLVDPTRPPPVLDPIFPAPKGLAWTADKGNLLTTVSRIAVALDSGKAVNVGVLDSNAQLPEGGDVPVLYTRCVRDVQ